VFYLSVISTLALFGWKIVVRVSSIAVGVNRLAYYVQIGRWHDDYEFLEFSLWNQSANLTALLVYNEIKHIS